MKRGPAPRRVLVFGTFDLLHAGHRSFLRQARGLGGELIVAIGRDRIVQKLKGRRPVHTEIRRQKLVEMLPIVGLAILAPRDPRRRFDFIRRLKPHTIALGYDQTHYTERLADDLKRRGLRIRLVRLRPYRAKRYKTSLLRQNV